MLSADSSRLHRNRSRDHPDGGLPLGLAGGGTRTCRPFRDQGLSELVAWEGQPEPDLAARAFDVGMRGYIGGDHTHRLPPREECPLAEFDAALQRSINRSRPSSAESSSLARPAFWRTNRSPPAKRSCSAPFAIRSSARYRSSWGSGWTMNDNMPPGGPC